MYSANVKLILLIIINSDPQKNQTDTIIITCTLFVRLCNTPIKFCKYPSGARARASWWYTSSQLPGLVTILPLPLEDLGKICSKIPGRLPLVFFFDLLRLTPH